MTVKAYHALEQVFENYYFLKRNLSILNWDSAVILNEAGVQIRAKQISYQQRAIQNVILSSGFRDLMLQVESAKSQLEPWQASNILEMQKIHDHITCIPDTLQQQLSEKTTIAEMSWRKAREEDNFKLYCDSMEPVIDLLKVKAENLSKQYGVTLYEGLMYEYDEGANEQALDTIFQDLANQLPVIIQNKLDNQLEKGQCPVHKIKVNKERQAKICTDLLKSLGFDFTGGRLDESEHPFTEGGKKDIRVTVKYHEDDFITTVLSALHECGHALYDINLPEQWFVQPIGYDKGMVVHEAIALFYEMFLTQSPSFSEKLFKIASQNGVKLDFHQIFLSLNEIKKSNIRIMADKITYIPHIILRYEIEKKLLNGGLNIKDLPEYWYERSKILLLTAPNSNQEGCLQDVHWPLGLFGYFPSYAKGLLFANTLNMQYSRFVENFDAINLLDALRKDIFSKGRLLNLDDFPSLAIQAERFVEYARCFT